jgi:type I restriction enzyme, S subunit
MTQKIPNDWQMIKIKDVITNDIEIFNESKYAGDYIRYIDISSVDNITKTVTEAKKILKNNAPSRAKSILKKDDIIISTVRPNLNAVARIEKEYEGCIASSGFSVIRLKPGYSPSYFFLFFYFTIIYRYGEQFYPGSNVPSN